MNLFQLKYFYDAVRLNSITDSGKVNLVTQSAVSQAIRVLETQFSTKLLHHKKNSFELTDSGRLAYSECSVIFGAVENLKANISRSSSILAGDLRIAATNSIALTLLAPALKSMSQNHPNLTIRLKLGNSDQVKEYLRTQEADIGVILEDDNMDEFSTVLIREGSFILAASPKLKSKNFKKQVIVTRQDKVEINHLRKQLGPEVRFQLEVFSWELIRQLCLEGAGVGYLPDYLIQNDLKHKKIQVIRSSLKTWKYKILAIQLKKRNLGAASHNFIETLISVVATNHN